jgi:pyridinium-3,5-bisthiocarboxylic acid mononucleotide nickel chelatase
MSGSRFAPLTCQNCDDMAKILYFDCPTGIAGNMCLGALLQLGVPLQYLEEKLAGLGLSHEYKLSSQMVQKLTQQATLVEVMLQNCAEHPDSHLHHRHLPDIEAIIQRAHLPERVKQWSLAIFETMAIAEGQVHGIPPQAVHFHEVGAVDAIVDIVGTCLSLDWLGVDRIFCSALPMGGGTVKAVHGILPVPAPAVLNLLASRQVPLYHNGIERELVTPTGAAIVVTLAEQFGPPPAMHLHQIGLGAGQRDLPQANILRLWWGEDGNTAAAQGTDGIALESIAVLETQMDDINPQVIGYLYDQLFAAGAVDVFTQSIGMKKSRPGILLTVICPPDAIAACERMLFQETPTLGIRRSLQHRAVLSRHLETIDTPFGVVRMKVATRGEHIINVQPEYEDCAKLARQTDKALQDIQRLACLAWETQQSPKSSKDKIY